MEQILRGIAAFEVARGANCMQRMVRGTAAGEQ
jgi:hypothetical protein